MKDKKHVVNDINGKDKNKDKNDHNARQQFTGKRTERAPGADPEMEPARWPNINYAWAGLLVEELIRNGVSRFCIAPGARSAPLALSAAAHPLARTMVHHDERGAAFFALGLSSAGHTAAIICSSGTAAANFFPAVIEASKKKIPIIVLTADRPPELRYTGAHQTIDQVRLYGSYPRFFIDMPAPCLEIPPQTVLTTVDQAVSLARGPLPGPVHLNCMFREPIAPDTLDPPPHSYYTPLNRWFRQNIPFTVHTGSPAPSHGDAAAEIAPVLEEAVNGVIVVGKIRFAAEADAILKLAETLEWPIFPDLVSGLRMRPHSHVAHYFDQTLLLEDWEIKYPVDTVLHLGGRLTSKRFYQWLERIKPERYITVLNHPLRNDPLHLTSHRVRSTPGAFASAILPLLSPRGHNPVCHYLLRASETVAAVLEDFTAGLESVSELGVARRLSELIPPEHGLFVSNSMPIRDLDMYTAVKPTAGDRPNPIGANRGASGIDGVIATACGFAAGLQRPVTLLTGDLAFLHDLSSLPLLKYLDKPFVIILIQNDGGGIFSFLPIARSSAAAEWFEPCLGAPHGLNPRPLAEMFGLQWKTPETMQQFDKIYRSAAIDKTPTIIEITSNRSENFEQHRLLQDRILQELNLLIKQMI